MKKKDQPKLAMFLTPTYRHSRVSIYHFILHVWRENTMIYQTNKIGNFVFA